MLTSVLGAGFGYNVAPQSVVYVFDSDVSNDLTLDDFVLDNLSTNSSIARSTESLAYIGSNGWQITFPGQSGSGVTGMLPDGNYDSILSEQGVPGISGEYRYSFFHLIADANHDRVVNMTDYSVMNSHMNQPGPWTWADGDFNLDTSINISDYALLSPNFSRQLPAPITAPGTASCYALSDSEMHINWSAPASGTWDGFRVFMSTDGVDFEQIAEVGPTTYTYTHSGRADGTKYWYRIRPFTNANGNGATTNKAWAVTVVPAPTDVTATALADDDGTAIVVSCTNNSPSAYGLMVQRATDSAFTQNVVEFAANTPDQGAFRDGDAVVGTTYYYRVRAVTRDGTSSYSLAASAVRSMPAPESPLAGYGIALSSTQAQLNWGQNVIGETGFRIERATDAEFTQNYSILTTTNPDVTSYTDSTVSVGLYWYRITTVRAGMDSRFSTIISVDTQMTTPAAPTELALEELPGENFLEWNDKSENESGFEILRATNEEFTENIESLGITIPNVTNFSDTDFDPETEYWYRVRAVKASLESDSAEVTTDATEASNTDVQFEILPHNGGDWVRRAATAVEIGQYIAGMPIHVRVALSTISKGDFGAFKPRYVWDFNDTPAQGGKFNTVEGLNAAHIYNTSGVRRITLRVELQPVDANGNPANVTAQTPIRQFVKHLDITVNADPRTNAASNATWNTVKVVTDQNPQQGETNWQTLLGNLGNPVTSPLSQNMRLQFKRGQTFDMPVNQFRNGIELLQRNANGVVSNVWNNIIVEPFGAGAAPILRVTTGGTEPNRTFFFGTDSTQRNIIFNGIQFDSTFSDAYAPADGPTTSGTNASPNILRGQGKNIALANCIFGHLFSGIESTAPVGTSGILYQGNSTLFTTDANQIKHYIGLKKYSLYLDGASNVVGQGNVLVDSRGESVFRFNIGNKFINLWSNDTIQWRAGAGRVRKSAFRLAGGPTVGGVPERAFFYAGANVFKGGENWFGPQPDGAPGDIITDSAVLDRNIFDNSVLRLNLGLRGAAVRSNVFRNIRSDVDGAIFVKEESPQIRDADEIVDSVLIAHNTLDVPPAGTQTNIFFRFLNVGRGDQHIRIKKLSLFNNLIALPATTVVPAGVVLEALTNPTVTWDTAIAPFNNGANPNSAKWTVRGNAWTIQPNNRFAWDTMPGAALNKTLAQWEAKTGGTTDDDVAVTVTANTFVPVLGAGETTLELSPRAAEAWWDFNGDVRTIANGNVTAGALKRN